MRWIGGLILPLAPKLLNPLQHQHPPLISGVFFVDAVKAIRRKPGRGEIQDEMLDHVFSNEATLKIVGATAEDALRGWRAWITIITQRNYTANSKVFQTGSELLDVLVNLKR